MQGVTVVDHPLLQHKLSLMRCKETDRQTFRRLLREVSLLLGYEVTRDLAVEVRPVETPLAKTRAPFLTGEKLVLVPILRAGNGLLDGMLDLLPAAAVGHVGLQRDATTLTPAEYYFKTPRDLHERLAIVLDPMLATGGSAVAAVQRLKAAKAQRIRIVCVVAAPEGIRAFRAAHPDVPIYTAAVDECLDGHGYILPGVGDVGDRSYGTA